MYQTVDRKIKLSVSSLHIQPYPKWPCKSKKPLKPIPSYLLLIV